MAGSLFNVGLEDNEQPSAPIAPPTPTSPPAPVSTVPPLLQRPFDPSTVDPSKSIEDTSAPSTGFNPSTVHPDSGMTEDQLLDDYKNKGVDPASVYDKDPELAYKLFEKRAKDGGWPTLGDVITAGPKALWGFGKGVVSGVPQILGGAKDVGYNVGHILDSAYTGRSGVTPSPNDPLDIKRARAESAGALLSVRNDTQQLINGTARNGSRLAALLTNGAVGHLDKDLSKEDVMALLKDQSDRDKINQEVQSGNLKPALEAAGEPAAAQAVASPEELQKAGYSGEEAARMGSAVNPVYAAPLGELLPAAITEPLARAGLTGVKYGLKATGSILDNPITRKMAAYAPYHSGWMIAHGLSSGNWLPLAISGSAIPLRAAGVGLKNLAEGEVLGRATMSPVELAQLRAVEGAGDVGFQPKALASDLLKSGAEGAAQIAPFAFGAQSPEEAGQTFGTGFGLGVASHGANSMLLGTRKGLLDSALKFDKSTPVNLSTDSMQYGTPLDKLHDEATAAMNPEDVADLNRQRHALQGAAQVYVMPPDEFQSRYGNNIDGGYGIRVQGGGEGGQDLIVYNGEEGFQNAKAHEPIHVVRDSLSAEDKTKLDQSLLSRNDPSIFASKYYSALSGKPVQVDFNKLPDKIPDPKDPLKMTKESVMAEMTADSMKNLPIDKITEDNGLRRKLQLGIGKMAESIGLPMTTSEARGVMGVQPSLTAISTIENAMRNMATVSADQGATYGTPTEGTAQPPAGTKANPSMHFNDVVKGLRGVGYSATEAKAKANQAIDDAIQKGINPNAEEMMARALGGKFPAKPAAGEANAAPSSPVAASEAAPAPKVAPAEPKITKDQLDKMVGYGFRARDVIGMKPEDIQQFIDNREAKGQNFMPKSDITSTAVQTDEGIHVMGPTHQEAETSAKNLGLSPSERGYTTKGGKFVPEDLVNKKDMSYDQDELYNRTGQYMPKVAPGSPEFKKWSEGAKVVLNSGPDQTHPDPQTQKMIEDIQGKQPPAHDFKTGEPVVVGAYHGTPSQFDAFDYNKLGDTTGAKSAKQGFFFSGTPETAKSYMEGGVKWSNDAQGEIASEPTGGALHEVYVKMKNPFVHDYSSETRPTYSEKRYSELIQKAKNEGHDGVILMNTSDGGPDGHKDNIFVTFDNKNIKSTANRGTFDPNNPNINFMPSSHPDAIKEPAIQTDDGRILTGKTPYHVSIAEENGIRSPWRAGFLTNKGEFLGRQEAWARAEALGQVPKKTYKASLMSEDIGGMDNASKITSTEGIPSQQVRGSVDEKAPLREQGETTGARPARQQGGAEAQKINFMPSNHPDAIRTEDPAALRTPDGKIWAGPWHPSAWADLTSHYSAEQLGKWIKEHGDNYVERGFMTNKGDFVNADEGLRRAVDHGQMTQNQVDRMEAQRQRAQQPARGLESLTFNAAQKGKPDLASQWMPKPASNDVTKVSDKYNLDQGRKPIVNARLSEPYNGEAIADAFDAMKHDPNNPRVKASYDAFKKEIEKEFNYARDKMGIKFDPTDEDPYALKEGSGLVKTVVDDVINNKHLGVFRGGNPLYEGHPLAEIHKPTGESYNTLFRWIHDIFGHVAGEHEFDEAGEESAWGRHKQMFPPEAVPAMTTETRGQTSWYFHNKEARKGNLGSFAEQKAGLLPDEFTQRPEIDRPHSSYPSGRIGAPGLWDSGMGGEAQMNLAKELGVNPDKRFYEQKPEAQSKITDYMKENQGAQFMPSVDKYDPNFKQPEPSSDETIRAALSDDKKDKVGAHRDMPEGTPVSVRIDIPSFNRTGEYVQTIHKPKVGVVQGYDSIVNLDGPVSFTANEAGAKKVKEGAPKYPLAAAEGKYNPDRSLPKDINNPDQWTPAGFDPKEHSYFYDKSNQEPIVGGDKAVMVGNTAYVKNPTYAPRENFQYMAKVAKNDFAGAEQAYNDANPDAVPTVFKRKKDGSFVLNKGKPVAEPEPWAITKTPEAIDATQGVVGKEAKTRAIEDRLEQKLNEAYQQVKDNPDITQARGWYKEIRNKLRPLFDSDEDTWLFCQLLGATSAGNRPRPNLEYAIDAFNGIKEGRFDELKKKANEAIDKGEFQGDYGYLESKGLLPKMSKVAKSTGEPSNYGTTGPSVLQVMLGQWDPPYKTGDYAANFSEGKTLKSVIDKWAARIARRVMGGQRIAPMPETGVTDTDYKVVQNAMHRLAEKLGEDPDDLQAILWFAEKDYWKQQGFTGKLSTGKGDLRPLLERTTKGPSGTLNFDPSGLPDSELYGHELEKKYGKKQYQEMKKSQKNNLTGNLSGATLED